MSGLKTYTLVAIGVFILGLRSAGQLGILPQLQGIPEEVWDFCFYLLGFGSIAALRHSIKDD